MLRKEPRSNASDCKICSDSVKRNYCCTLQKSDEIELSAFTRGMR